MDIQSAQVVFQKFPKIFITPLDSCGSIKLDGTDYQTFKKSKGTSNHSNNVIPPKYIYHSEDSVIAQAILENFKVWAKGRGKWDGVTEEESRGDQQSLVISKSSILFDTVAIYMAFDTAFLEVKELPIVITDDALMKVDKTLGKPIRVATEMTNLNGFRQFLLSRLLQKKSNY